MAEIEITKPKQLLVEGRTPLIFFVALLRHMQLKDVEVQNFGSINELAGFLPSFVARPEFKDLVRSYGIIRDAEQQPAASAFESVCYSVKTAGHEPPKQIAVFTQNTPKVGVYILPNCFDKGMLETICLESIMTPELSKCIEAFFQCADSAGFGPARNGIKARIRAFLATQEIDEAQVGRAAQKGLWNWKHEAFTPLQTFLTSL